jgi:hypothetical protein
MHVQCPKKGRRSRHLSSLVIEAIGLSMVRILVDNQKNWPLKWFQHTTLTTHRCPVAVYFLLNQYNEGFHVERESKRESFDVIPK